MDRETMSCNVSFPQPLPGERWNPAAQECWEVLLQMENFPVIPDLKISMARYDTTRHHWAQGEDSHGDVMATTEHRNDY